MRYAYPIPKLALFDLPSIQKDRHVRESYFEKIFRQLLVYDQTADNNLEEVLAEAIGTLRMPDPAFEILSNNQYQRYIKTGAHLPRWQKIIKDYYYFVESENKRRNADNPYHPIKLNDPESWNTIPDLSKQKKNAPYYFDHLYRDAQQLNTDINELTKDYKGKNDKDLFKVKVNGILVPNRILFALNNTEELHSFAELEISIMDIKMGLDALKQAQIFLNRALDTLYKISWSAKVEKPLVDKSIAEANQIGEKIKNRITEMENKFMLFISARAEE